MDSVDSAEKLVNEHDLQHTLEYKDKAFAIPLFIADGAIDVKLHDLDFDTPNAIIAEHMKQYGEVLAIKNDSWRTLFNCVPSGVRILRMRVKKQIPSYISIAGEMTLATHKNQIPTCRHCARRVHYTMKCSEYAKSLQEESKNKTNQSRSVRGRIDDIRNISPVSSRGASPISSNLQSASQCAHISDDEPVVNGSIPAYRPAATVGGSGATLALPKLQPAPVVNTNLIHDVDLVEEIDDCEYEEVIESSAAGAAEPAVAGAAGATAAGSSTTLFGSGRNDSRSSSRTRAQADNFKRPGSPTTKNLDTKRPSRTKHK